MKKTKLGIKKKVSLGFVVIGLILFLSGVIALFEFGRMSRYVSSLIANNITTVNTARVLLNMGTEYNTRVFEAIGDNDPARLPKRGDADVFLQQLDRIYEHSTVPQERVMADSVRYAYAAYMQVANELETLWTYGYVGMRDWYFNRFQVVYDQLEHYLQELTKISQDALAQNYYNLQDSFYRSIMPGVVSVGAGIILVLLFNYFLNVYLLSPIVRMSRELRAYRDFNKSYHVMLDGNEDQLDQLNDDIRDLVEENKTLKRNQR